MKSVSSLPKLMVAVGVLGGALIALPGATTDPGPVAPSAEAAPSEAPTSPPPLPIETAPEVQPPGEEDAAAAALDPRGAVDRARAREKALLDAADAAATTSATPAVPEAVPTAPPPVAPRHSDVPEPERVIQRAEPEAYCGPSTSGKNLLRELARARARRAEQLAALDKARREIEEAKAALAEERVKVEARLAELESAERRAKEKKAKELAEGSEEEREQAEAVLAKVVGKMGPAAGARLLAGLKPALAASLLKRMSPRQGGAVLEAMAPEQAAQLAVTATRVRGETP